MSYKNKIKQIPGARFTYQLLKRTAKKLNKLDFKIKSIEEIKSEFIKSASTELKEFLDNSSRITFPKHQTYQVSVVIPVFNKAEFTYRCLQNLAKEREIALEVIVIDNASTDQTKELLSQVDHIKVINNQENQHFLKATNQGAKLATAPYVLFLNNDAEPNADAISNALKTIESNQQIAAVGAKLILPDQTLQEAGCIVWRDGTCDGYGRGWGIDQAEAQFTREVDYCSGAFLLTKKTLLEQVNYLDERFAPAYYEELDLCLMFQSMGLKVIYDPNVIVHHFEFASGGMSKAIELMNTNRIKLLKKHGSLLKQKYDRLNPPHLARSLDSRKKILYIDQLLPLTKVGAGYPRANTLVNALSELGYFVSVYPLMQETFPDSWSTIYNEFHRDIEILCPLGDKPGFREQGLIDFASRRVNYYDYVWISRPSTMHTIRTQSPNLGIFAGAKIIYDAEAIFTLRDIVYGKIKNLPLSPEEIAKKFAYEFSLCEGVDAVSSVSPSEAKYFLDHGISQVEILSFSHDIKPHQMSFENRQGLIFLGAMHDDFGPNSDSIIWFVGNVLPLLKAKGFKDKLYIVGTNNSPLVKSIKDPQVEVTGAVDHLDAWINKSRVFIAPTRFAAGIPHKVTEASSHGIPAVVSELLHEQLSWEENSEYLVGRDPNDYAEKILTLYNSKELWDTVSHNATERIKKSFSQKLFYETIQKLLNN